MKSLELLNSRVVAQALLKKQVEVYKYLILLRIFIHSSVKGTLNFSDQQAGDSNYQDVARARAFWIQEFAGAESWRVLRL